MTDLGREIENAVRAEWSEERARSAEAGVRLRRRRRVVARAALATVVSLAALVGGGWALWNRAPRVAAGPVASSATLRFDDGSTAIPVGEGSQLRTTAALPGRVVVEIVRGAGRFDVVPDPARVFHVEGGPVVAEAFGARFAFARYDQKARVEVFEGSVRILWADQQRQLLAGERGSFPVDEAPSPPPEPIAGPAPRKTVRPVHSAQPSWRDLASDGDYDRAYEVLTRAGAPTVRDEAQELLLAADVHRLSHHPAEAVAPLRQILRDHRADPRASLAAFTLGRVLLEELGRPLEAADAFAEAEALAPGGPMSEDTVAREVEAWSRAGDAVRAHRLAEEYVRRYPAGRKLRSVRRFGELE